MSQFILPKHQPHFGLKSSHAALLAYESMTLRCNCYIYLYIPYVNKTKTLGRYELNDDD